MLVGFLNMLSFLKSVVGSDITEAEYRYADDTPYYIDRKSVV